MSARINPGDTVMLVHSPCAHLDEALGRPFRVSQVLYSPKDMPCVACGRTIFRAWRTKARGPLMFARGLESYQLPLAWLRKFDAPTETIKTETREERHAHA